MKSGCLPLAVASPRHFDQAGIINHVFLVIFVSFSIKSRLTCLCTDQACILAVWEKMFLSSLEHKLG